MAFTTQELNNITASALDYNIRGEAFANAIQEKPLLSALTKKQKTFPGGKGNITVPVVFDYTTAVAGFTGNDTVSYANPANVKRASFPWKEIHAGISLTLTELKIDGLSVVDSLNGDSTSKHSERDLTVLTGLLEQKLADMTEGWAKSFNSMLWQDGTQDAKVVPGLLSLITDNPSTGTVGGIDRATVTKWRNRSAVGTVASPVDGYQGKLTYVSGQQVISKFLRNEVRQLTRFGGKPDLILAGSGFIQKLEAEIESKGLYTQQGFIKNGTTDIGIAKISILGVGDVMYDPTLDDLGRSNFAYFIDRSNVNLYVMDGEDKKTHSPARPHDQYVLYRAMTWTGGLAARQLNGCGVYEVA
jgi:hypothetical protein